MELPNPSDTDHSIAAKVARTKPLLRGWFHAGAAVGVAPFLVALCWVSRTDLSRAYSMLVFGLSMLALYTVSAIYHLGNWQGSWQRIWHKLDHSNIFVFIAATYTAICYNVLTGWERAMILILVWLFSVTGVVLSLLTVPIPRWVKTSLYIGLGWLGLLVLPAIWNALPWTAIALMILGGLLYTLGGVIFAMRWPDPFPRVLGYHELFHLLVIAGGAIYVLVIWVWIVPFPNF